MCVFKLKYKILYLIMYLNFVFYSGQSLRVATALSNFTCNIFDIDAGSKSTRACLEHEKKIVDVK